MEISTSLSFQREVEVMRRASILRGVQKGTLTLCQAASILHLSYRHTLRLWKRFQKEGHHGLKDRRGHPSSRRIPETLRKEILRLRRESYPSLNLSHFVEKLHQQGIRFARETIRRLLLSEGLHQKWKGKRGKPRYPFEAPAAGMLVQMDTSRHRWIPDDPTFYSLILLLDDHSRAILYARLVPSDTLEANFQAIERVLKRYGLFHTLYTDNDSKFRPPGHPRSVTPADQKPVSIIESALGRLGIRLTRTPPYEPQGRGKIERLFGFLQDRLTREFSIAGVHNLSRANRILKEWVHWYHHRPHNGTGTTPAQRLKNHVFVPLPRGIHLPDLLCRKETRIVRADNTFSLDGLTYQVPVPPDRATLVNCEVSLHIRESSIRVFYKNRYLGTLKRTVPLTSFQVKKRCDILSEQKYDISMLQ